VEQKTITTGAEVWVDQGVVHIRSRGVTSTADTVAETLAAVRKLVPTGPHPLVWDLRPWPGAAPGAWSKMIPAAKTVFSAAAVLVDESTTPDISSFTDAIDGLLIPLRVFTEEDAAIEFASSHG
jgi:hypothetical protein